MVPAAVAAVPPAVMVMVPEFDQEAITKVLTPLATVDGEVAEKVAVGAVAPVAVVMVPVAIVKDKARSALEGKLRVSTVEALFAMVVAENEGVIVL